MVLTVNPAEAQAMQEDTAQLLSAIAQAAKLAIATLSRSTDPSTENLKIQMGRRQAYGQMADGQFRNELDANARQVISESLQRPVAVGVEASQYRGKVPAIEIREGDTLLFREERDGTITANAIELQLEQSISKNQTLTQTSIAAEPVAANLSSADQATNIAQIADYLINPLGETQPVYDSVSVGDYRIKQNGNTVTVSRDDELILIKIEDRIINERVTRQDWQAFQAIENRLMSFSLNENVWNLESRPERSEEVLLSQEYSNLYELWDDLGRMTTNELIITATQRFDLYPDGVETVELENNLLKRYEVIQDILTAYKTQQAIDSPAPQDQVILTADVADATASQDVLPAIAIAERETAKLPEGNTKQLLQNTVQDWQQQFAQTAHKTVHQSQSWLTTRLQHWRNHRLARTAIDLFNRGYERTGERWYRVGQYTISRKERDRYVLKDAKGELLQFQLEKTSILGINRQRFHVLAASDRLSHKHLRDLQTVQQDKLIAPQGELDLETNYALKTHRAEQTVRGFLQNYAKANVWEKDGGRFKLEIGVDGFLQITDKQAGRGVVFQRQNGAVFSKLNAQDLAHFERLAAKMQQAQQPVPQPKPELNGHASKKMPALELE
jgi:hypothetical protein